MVESVSQRGILYVVNTSRTNPWSICQEWTFIKSPVDEIKIALRISL